MRGFFDSLKSILRTDKAKTDSAVFRLHYKVTFCICLASSLLVTGREYFGDAITCIPPGEEYMQKIVDTYCWIHSTFTVPGGIGKRIGSEVAHPGVEKFTPGMIRTQHKYYQWVCFVLFFQGVCFYFPRYLWKLWEQGKMRNLSTGLESAVQSEEEKRSKIEQVVSYLAATLRTNDAYMAQYVACEVIAFVNVVLQIYVIDVFLGGSFSSFGLDVLRHSDMNPDERTDPMIRVFPRMTKCNFHFYGSSGDVQKYDTLCILPLNVINEKIYIFLWFWLMFLCLLTFASLAVRVILLFSPRLRLMLICRKAKLTDRYLVRHVADHLRVSDWFLLHMLSKNIDPLNFWDVLTELARDLKADRNGNGSGKAPLLGQDTLISAPLATEGSAGDDV